MGARSPSPTSAPWTRCPIPSFPRFSRLPGSRTRSRALRSANRVGRPSTPWSTECRPRTTRGPLSPPWRSRTASSTRSLPAPTCAATARWRTGCEFLETVGTSAAATECSLVGATGRCTDQGTQTTAQAAAKGQGACTAAGGEWTPSFVQRNKHGGIYTYGNLERYPFGRHIPYTDSQNALAYHHETGFTTYGYTSYESLYGYTKPGAVDNA